MKKRKEDVLIDQFYTILNTTCVYIKEKGQGIELNKESNGEIEELLVGEKSWDAGYKIEQLMIPLLYGDDLDTTVSKSVFNAEKLGRDTSVFYKSQFDSAKSDTAKQAILKLLIQDLQSHNIKMRLRQAYINNAWHLASYAFIAVFILFFLPYFFPVILHYLYKLGEGQGRAIDIFTAVTSGAMGASFSLLTGLKGRINKSSFNGLKLLQRKSYVISKIITGFGAGLIFFYFLQSGLLSGVAFPEYGKDSVPLSENVNLDMKNLALLVIWCFLSGFSEKLVPTILSKTEGQVNPDSTEIKSIN